MGGNFKNVNEEGTELHKCMLGMGLINMTLTISGDLPETFVWGRMAIDHVWVLLQLIHRVVEAVYTT